MQQLLTETARSIKRLENMERRKRCCFQGFMKVLFPRTESRLYPLLLSIRETSSVTYGLVEEWREGTSRRQLSVEKEGSRAKIWEKTPMKPTPQWLWQWEADLPETDGAKGGNLASAEHQCLCRGISNRVHTTQLCQNALSLCSSRQKQQHSNSVLGILILKSRSLSTYSKASDSV